MKTFETKNTIKDRILQEMAREWGYRGKTDIDLNAFDPVVDMMLGACSFELERLSNDITNSRNRIFERLVEILTPDVMTQAQPAHTIIHAMPTEYQHKVTPYDAVYHKSLESRKDIFFSPMETYTLFDTRVEMMAYDNRIVKINNRLEKDLAIESSYGSYLSPGHCYLGLKVNPNIRSLKDHCFFFDWKNNVRLNSLLKYLPMAQWYIGDQAITTKSGHNTTPPAEANQETDIFSTLGIDQQMKTSILGNTERHFITIDDDAIPIHKHLSTYDSDFEGVFLDSDLTMLQEDLLWVKIILPQTLKEHTSQMDCLTNCYPTVNRKLIEKQEKLDINIHIIPLEVEDAHFLSIDEMTNTSGTSYKEVPLKMVDDGDYGMYAIRHRGVKRFDTREAHHMIDYVLDLIRHESAAFKGLGYSTLGEDFKDLDVVFNRIRKNFKRSKANIENTTFLFTSPFPDDNLIFLKYWTTEGSLANRIPHGTPLKLSNNTNLVAKSIQMVTPSKGGRDHLQAVDSIHAFKEVIMTRGRIVTMEDIKIFCTNKLGVRNIASIDLSRGVSVSKDTSQGLIRTIDVHIIRKINSQLSQADWQVLCNETEASLESRSAGMYPIRIITTEAVPVP